MCLLYLKSKLDIIYANQAQLIANIIVGNQKNKKKIFNIKYDRFYTLYAYKRIFTKINTQHIKRVHKMYS